MKAIASIFISLTVLFTSQPLMYWHGLNTLVQKAETSTPQCNKDAARKQQEEKKTCDKTTGCNSSSNTNCAPCHYLLAETPLYKYSWRSANAITIPTYAEGIATGHTNTLLQPPELAFI